MIVRASAVDLTQGALALDSWSLAKAYDLCPGERFTAQPSVGLCSATLVEPDLVLTAGHCMTAVPCEQWAVVRGFQYEAPSAMKSLRDQDLGYCARVIASRVDGATEERRLDYAWVRLDRPFDGTEPLPRLDRGVLEKDTVVVMMGHPMGIPTKIDGGGRVEDPRSADGDYFVTSSDAFVGDSGAGVFDQTGGLRGIAVRGSDDVALTNEGCYETVSLDAGLADEKATYLGPALDDLCARDGSWHVCGGHGHGPREVSSCSVTAPGRGTSSRLAVGALVVTVLFRRRLTSDRRRRGSLRELSRGRSPHVSPSVSSSYFRTRGGERDRCS